MQKKIIIAIILNTVVISTTLGVISYLTVHGSIQKSLQSRLALAGIIRDYVESSLQSNLNRLYDISLSGKINLRDNNWEPAKKALETAYRYSLFTDGVFLLDKHGNQLLTYPPHDNYLENLTYINYVSQVLLDGKPIISNVYTIEPLKKQVIFMMVPLTDKEGNRVGVAGGIISPTNPFMTQLLHSVKIEENSYIEIVDLNEIVVASDNPARILRHHDHERSLSKMIQGCRSGIRECRHGFSQINSAIKPVDILAFVPLKVAPWGVIVGQAKDQTFAPANDLQKRFLFIVFIFVSTAIIFAIGMSRSIVKPLKALSGAANRIADGDLSTPVGKLGGDEILVLSSSFDDMRKRLAESLDRIKNHNVELEQAVVLRTAEIRVSQQKVESLLKKVINTQEEERKRIARGLHDTILQDMSAFLIKLDICRLHPEQVTVGKIDDMRAIALTTMDGIHNVVQNMRPSILDDLGLDSAIVWLLNKHLAGKGVDYYLGIDNPNKKRFPSVIEITLFRIIQEAIVNIARHAQAQDVFVTLKVDDLSVYVCVEDDGKGFDVNELMQHTSDDGRGLGVLGMMERASLLDAKFLIHSGPGDGTRMSVRVPLKDSGGDNA